jgi:hypothetical protein
VDAEAKETSAMTTSICGTLEIDHDRGVVYFHADEKDYHGITQSVCPTPLRICSLPTPIPRITEERSLDITHMVGADWRARKPVMSPRLPRYAYHCEAFTLGQRIGGFVIDAADMSDVLSKAAINIEVVIRPEQHELRITKI